VSSLLALMNYIKAESLIARDAKTSEKHRLDERTAPATLKIVHQVGDAKENKTGTAEIYISEDLSDKPTQPKYYARLKDSMTVFQINGLFVASLKQAPVPRKEEKEEKKEEKPDKDK
jgi:hypothetical protein